MIVYPKPSSMVSYMKERESMVIKSFTTKHAYKEHRHEKRCDGQKLAVIPAIEKR